jgi:hypothetical protein
MIYSRRIRREPRYLHSQPKPLVSVEEVPTECGCSIREFDERRLQSGQGA